MIPLATLLRMSFNARPMARVAAEMALTIPVIGMFSVDRQRSIRPSIRPNLISVTTKFTRELSILLAIRSTFICLRMFLIIR